MHWSCFHYECEHQAAGSTDDDPDIACREMSGPSLRLRGAARLVRGWLIENQSLVGKDPRCPRQMRTLVPTLLDAELVARLRVGHEHKVWSVLLMRAPTSVKLRTSSATSPVPADRNA